MVKWFPIAFGEEKMGLSLTYLFSLVRSLRAPTLKQGLLCIFCSRSTRLPVPADGQRLGEGAVLLAYGGDGGL